MKVIALAGGVGGAKLAYGLSKILAQDDFAVVVNTGDDFDYWGLRICPDIDTVCYTLAGMANRATGWGVASDSWRVLQSINTLGGPSWFRLGDRDLGTHIERTRRLKQGQSLSAVTRHFCSAWGVGHSVLPMSDDVVSTILDTDQGQLDFQEYFVHRGFEPRVRGFEFRGADTAKLTPGLEDSIRSCDRVVLCPSNPWVSIAPILATGGLRALIDPRKTVAISPIVGGQALRGPADKMYVEMGKEPSAVSVAEHYRGLISSLVIDRSDIKLASSIRALGIEPIVTNIVMRSVADRRRLAAEVLDLRSSAGT